MKLPYLIVIKLLIFFTCRITFAQPTNAKFVWTDSEGSGRMEFAYFRYNLTINDLPKEATFHLYAANLYHLKVNGMMINTGPLRAFPQNPSYDSYDLAPFLHKGKNVIAVKVLHDGVYNFQMPKMPGGFIAWGTIKGGLQSFDLQTPGNWLCNNTKAYNRQTPKFSFATGAMEIYDEREEIKHWDEPNADLKGWKKPFLLNNQNYWGKLFPRPIPHLTQKELSAKLLLGVYDFDQSEDIYAFQSKVPDEIQQDYGHQWPHFAYTYIYSPKNQEVKVGSFWGNFYLNGMLVEPQKKTDKQNPVRYERIFPLKEGWNYLFIAQKPLWGSWDFYMALPKSSALIVSAKKQQTGETPIFMVAGPFKKDEETTINALAVPFEPERLPNNLSATWQPRYQKKINENPARDAAWLEFNHKQKNYPKHATTNIKLDAGKDRALVFDIGRKTLGRLFLEVDAPEGTVFDIIIAEDLNKEKIYVFKRLMVASGSRFISAGGESRFEHFKPYGMRFVQINVRNHNTPVIIKKVGVTEQIYPFEQQGSFTCSDPFFNELWEMGWRTLQVCAEDTYTDTPFRERGLYAGDMLPEYAITQVASGDPRLLEYSLIFLNGMYADRFNPEVSKAGWKMGKHFEFPYAALHAWHWSYKTRGNTALARQQWLKYKNLIDWSFKQQDEKTGLLWAEHVFIEWTKLEKNDTYNTVYNASVVGACRELAEVAVSLGFGEYKAELEKKAVQLSESINQHLWNDEKGAYWDGIKAGKKLSTYYPISSAFCSIYNVANDTQRKKILAHYARILPNIGNQHRAMLSSAYGSFYVLADLFMQEEVGMAEAFYKKYWLPQVEWGDTNFENFKALEGKGQGTLSHAWSGHATYYLSTQTLGVQMGYPEPFKKNKIIIAPQSETISWAKGTVPHPLGNVSVSWEIKGEYLFLNYHVPEGVAVEVKPRGRLANLKLKVTP
ncbi:MAG: family 78 glycoside hydrolase catalytic domain [Bacteroidota bacterium]